MGVDKAKEFVVWALSHARPDLIPSGTLAADLDRCGVDPWECLLGTNGQKCTDQLLTERYIAAYSAMGWGAIAFETITCDWVDRGVSVCDGPGLLNAYLLELGIAVKMTPHGIFSRLCDNRMGMADTNRAYTVGEAVFQANCYGVMKRVGWVCGFDTHGEPLIIEAKGVAYGVCIERSMGQGWTHRARMHLEINKEDTDER